MSIRTRLVGTNIPPSERLISGALGAAVIALGVRRRGALGTIVAIGGAALLGRAASGRCALYRERALRGGPVRRSAVTVARPRAEVYRLWRDLRDLPSLLTPIQTITVVDPKVSRWEIAAGDSAITWSAEIDSEEADRLIAWRSLSGRGFEQTLTVELTDAPGGGTEIHLELGCRPGDRPAPALRALVAALGEGFLEHELERMARRYEALAPGAPGPHGRTAPSGMPPHEPPVSELPS